METDLIKRIEKIEDSVSELLYYHNSGKTPTFMKDKNFLMRCFEYIRARLQESSTFQGLVVLIPIGLTHYLDIDKETATEIVFTALSIVAGHNVIRKETNV